MLKRFMLYMMVAATVLCVAGNASAQGRLSDKDLEKLIGNLKDDSGRFAETFKKDLSKSTIRKTSEEKAARQLAERFPKQVEGMLRQFKSKKKADAAVPAVHQSYRQLDRLMDKVSPTPKTVDAWSRIRQEMEQITQAFNFIPPA